MHLFGEYSKHNKYFHQTYSKPKECLDCKGVLVKEPNKQNDDPAKVSKTPQAKTIHLIKNQPEGIK